MLIADPLLVAGFDKPVSRQLLVILSLSKQKNPEQSPLTSTKNEKFKVN